jgi:hypothetical protein
MRAKHSVTALLFCLVLSALTGLEPLPPCHPLALASAGLTTLTDDPALTGLNPVAGEGGFSTSTSFISGMTQLNQYELASAINYEYNSMYVSWQSLENEDYIRRDIRFGFRYTNYFFRLGAGYKMLYDEIPGYGSEKQDNLVAGIRLRYKQTVLDARSELALPAEGDDYASCCEYNLTLGQKLDNSLALAAGIQTIKGEDIDLKLGCRYQITPNFQGLTSWNSDPGSFGVGAIFNVRFLQVAYALKTHSELNWTHSIGLSALFP